MAPPSRSASASAPARRSGRERNAPARYQPSAKPAKSSSKSPVTLKPSRLEVSTTSALSTTPSQSPPSKKKKLEASKSMKIVRGILQTERTIIQPRNVYPTLAHKYVQEGNGDELRDYLQTLTDQQKLKILLAKDDTWASPLYKAVKSNNTKCAKIILSSVSLQGKMELLAQADSDAFNRNPFYIAVESDYIPMIKLLKKHLPLEAKSWICLFLKEAESFSGWTPVHAAARHDSVEVLKIILSTVYASDIVKLLAIQTKHEKCTPLHLSVAYDGTGSALGTMLKFVPPDKRVELLKIRGLPTSYCTHRTVLIDIVQTWKHHGPEKLTAILDSLGSSIKELLSDDKRYMMNLASPAGGRAFLQILKSRPETERSELIKVIGRNPLTWAAKTNIELFRYMLNLLFPKELFTSSFIKSEVRKMQDGVYNLRPLICDVFYVIKEKASPSITALLIDRIPREILQVCAGSKGSSSLHIACESKNRSAIKCLLKKGISLDDADREGRTPLLCAIRHHDCEMIADLTKAGAVGNIFTVKRSSLLRTIQINCLDCLKQVYKNTKRVNYSENIGKHVCSHLEASLIRSYDTALCMLAYLLKECAQPNFIFSSTHYDMSPTIAMFGWDGRGLLSDSLVMIVVIQLCMDVGIKIEPSRNQGELLRMFKSQNQVLDKEQQGFYDRLAGYSLTSIGNGIEAEPHTLQSIARRVVRTRLKNGCVSDDVKQLTIPKHLMDYISMEYANKYTIKPARFERSYRMFRDDSYSSSDDSSEFSDGWQEDLEHEALPEDACAMF